MIINGFLSLFLYTFYLGSSISFLVDLDNKKNYFINTSIIAIISSLYFSWFLVLFKLLFDLSISIYYFYVFITLLNIYLIYQKKLNQSVIDIKEAAYFFIFLSFFTILFFRSPEYALTFSYGDAVVSWNKWAIEISQNKFEKLIGFYPIFWPGLWSLIYDSQDNVTFWIFTKASLLVVTFLYFLLVFKFLKNKKYLDFAFFAIIFLGIFLQYPSNIFLHSGYMDIPVTLLSIILFMMVIQNLKFNDSPNSFNICIFSFLVGIISITKFSGFFTLLIYSIYLIYNFKKNLITKKIFISNTFVSFLPFLTFLVIYFKIINFNIFDNNFYDLLNFSISKSDGNIFIKSFLRILEIANPLLLFLIFGLSLINFFKKDEISFFGRCFFIIFILGIFIFSTVSYDVRNFFYLIFILIISSYCGFNNLNYEKKILNLSFLKKYFILFLVISVFISSYIIDKFFGHFLLIKDKQKLQIMHPLTKRQLESEDYKFLYDLIKKE